MIALLRAPLSDGRRRAQPAARPRRRTGSGQATAGAATRRSSTS